MPISVIAKIAGIHTTLSFLLILRMSLATTHSLPLPWVSLSKNSNSVVFSLLNDVTTACSDLLSKGLGF